MTTAPDPLHTLAHAHLPADLADRWTALLRPAAHLRKAGPADPVVGRLGGLPRLPDGVDWPVWEGRGPLGFVAAVDCAALPGEALDISLPADGVLAFFYYGDEDDDALVDTADPNTWPGARVLHLPPGSAAAPERPAPAGITPYPEMGLTVHTAPSAPDFDSLALTAAFGEGELPDAFQRAVWQHQSGAAHQIGGHAQSVQTAVEIVVAHGALGGREVSWEDPRIEKEAEGWVLLAQFDSDEDADMMWGDDGALYWLIRPDDLAAGRFERAMFTWQCC
ncbi:YwqG family protein [Streptomyces sparsogenes]|uniref:YwqG family protein n=1 Tax=Streptomyces sparsogenes TaxID=67365 RepID=UPI0033D9F3FA